MARSGRMAPLPPQVAEHDVRIVIEDLARVHQTRGIEDLLHAFQDLVIRVPELAAHKARPDQADRVLAADGASEGPSQRIDVLGDRPHLLPILGIAQIDVRADVQLAVPGVAEEVHRDAILLLDLVETRQILGQPFVIDAHVFHELRRMLAAAFAVQQRPGILAGFPDAGLRLGVRDRCPAGRLFAHGPVGRLDPRADFVCRLAHVLDHQHRRRPGGQNVAVLRKLVNRQMSQHLVHQLAGGWIGLHDDRDRPRHAFERVELQLQQPLGRRHRHRPQSDAREDGQGPFRSGDEMRQVNRTVVADAGDVVAAPVPRGRGLSLGNHVSICGQERPALPGDRARPVLGQLLHVQTVAKFDDSAVGEHRLDAFDIGGSVAVLQRMRAGRVIAHDAPDGRPIPARWVRTDFAAGFQQALVQVIQDHAGLARDRLALRSGESASCSGSCRERCRGTRTRRPARCRTRARHGKAVLGRVPHHRDDILHVARRHHALRQDPITAGIGAEGDAMDDVCKNIAANQLGQIRGNLRWLSFCHMRHRHGQDKRQPCHPRLCLKIPRQELGRAGGTVIRRTAKSSSPTWPLMNCCTTGCG